LERLYRTFFAVQADFATALLAGYRSIDKQQLKRLYLLSAFLPYSSIYDTIEEGWTNLPASARFPSEGRKNPCAELLHKNEAVHPQTDLLE
jgi:hypothetical protein